MANTFSSRVEFEKLERAAIRILYAGLNTQIDAEAAEWAAEDSAWATAMSRAPVTVQVEHIDGQNFYPGHQPTLIEAPIERYPNVSAMAYRAQVQNVNDDHMNKYAVFVAIEIMCKAVGPEDRDDTTANALACELVNSRVKRTLAAAHKVMMSNEGLSFGKLVPRQGNTPDEFTTDVFVRKQEKGRGPRWFWQGARMDYRVEQWVSLHS